MDEGRRLLVVAAVRRRMFIVALAIRVGRAAAKRRNGQRRNEASKEGRALGNLQKAFA